MLGHAMSASGCDRCVQTEPADQEAREDNDD